MQHRSETVAEPAQLASLCLGRAHQICRLDDLFQVLARQDHFRRESRRCVGLVRHSTGRVAKQRHDHVAVGQQLRFGVIFFREQELTQHSRQHECAGNGQCRDAMPEACVDREMEQVPHQLQIDQRFAFGAATWASRGTSHHLVLAIAPKLTNSSRRNILQRIHWRGWDESGSGCSDTMPDKRSETTALLHAQQNGLHACAGALELNSCTNRSAARHPEHNKII